MPDPPSGFESIVVGAALVQINISTRHGHLSETTRTKIEEKVGKLSRLFERLTAIDVTVDLEHSAMPKVDLRVSTEHKHDFVADAQSEDLMAGLDGAMHKIEQQLRKYKERGVDRNRTPGARQQEMPVEPESSED